MGKGYNKFRRFCAFLLGAVFFVSGLLKLVDPVGAGLVIGEYLKFMHLDFLKFASEWIGVTLALMEAFLGLALTTGLWRRVIAIITVTVLTCFTALTILLLIFNPVMDCGCFGEVVHLTHLQSLIKNIVLCVLAVLAFTPMRKLGRPKRHKYVSFVLVAGAVVAFTAYSLLYIPLVDFTDFRPTAHLEAAIESQEDIYEATFIYEKDGEQARFNLDHLPDSTWTYVSTETSMKNVSDEVVASLSLRNSEGTYCDAVATYGGIIVISIYDPARLSADRWHKIAQFVRNADHSEYGILVVVPGNAEDIYGWRNLSAADARTISGCLYFSDYKTLITLNRSNGGATYFQDGYLVRKWAVRNLPDLSKLYIKYSGELSEGGSVKGNLMFQALLLYSFAIMLLV